MKVFQSILFLLVLLWSCVSLHGRYLLVYRNDGLFNMVPLDEKSLFEHNIGEEGEFLVFSENDEEKAVPLSAIDSCVVRHSDIPVLRFTFPDHSDHDQVWLKEEYITALLDVEGNGYADGLEDDTLKIKGRGNSSWAMPKKPMRLKFPAKTPLCGLKSSKSFVLLADYLDNTHMKNAVAFWLARRLGVPYANESVPCQVYINRRYTGAFLLTHKLGINGTSVDIDESQGMLFELSTEFDEKYKFRSSIFNLPVMVKDPDFEELYAEDPAGLSPEERLAAWQADFYRAEVCADSGKGFEEFDLESFVTYMLVNNVVGNDEIGYPKSVYIHKSSMAAGELYRFGPVWDFDISFNRLSPDGDSFVGIPADAPLWTNALFRALADQPEFAEAYKSRFDEFEKEILPDMLGFIDEYSRLIEPSSLLDGCRWPDYESYGWIYRTPSSDNKAAVKALKEWIIARTAFLRSRLEEGHPY